MWIGRQTIKAVEIINYYLQLFVDILTVLSWCYVQGIKLVMWAWFYVKCYCLVCRICSMKVSSI